MDFMSLLEGFVQLTYYLGYLAIAVHFLCKKDNSERFKFLMVVIGVFAILFVSMGLFSSPGAEWDFSLTQMAIMVFLAFNGIPMMINKGTAFILFAIYLARLFGGGFFLSFAIGMIAYVIITWGLIISAIEAAEKRFGGKQPAKA